jgi:glycerol-3-phosphate acyltransferase PlsY
MVAAYLVGSIPSAYVIPRVFAGMDIRRHGSGNLGATNVYRLLGWKYAVPVMLFDVAKGAAPVLAARFYLPQHWMPLTVGLAGILGHVYSVFMGFRGGKGVATSAGVVLGLVPKAVGGSVLIWGVVLAVWGYVSLASIVGTASFPFWAWLFYPEKTFTFWVGLALAGFIVFTHRSNIRRLRDGTENRRGRARPPASS